MYKLPERLLVENPIKRYSIGSPTKGLKFNKDGSLTLYVSSTSPGKSKEANWLPAPQGPFWTVMQFYGQAETVIDGTNKAQGYEPTVATMNVGNCE